MIPKQLFFNFCEVFVRNLCKHAKNQKVLFFEFFAMGIVMAVFLLSVIFGPTSVLAAIDFGSVSTAQNGNSGGNLTINIPSSTASGDVLVASIVYEKGDGASVSAPFGWTLIRQTDNGNKVGLRTYYKVAGSSEPALSSWNITQTSNGNSKRGAGGIIRYTGVDTANPIDVSAASTSKSTSAVAPSVTTTVVNDRVIAVYGLNASSSFGTPSGTTERFDTTNTNGSGPAAAGDDFVQTSAGSTGTKTASVPNKEWAAQTIALKAIPPSGKIVVIKNAITNDAQDFTFHNNFGNGNPATFQLDDDSGAPGANGTFSNTRDSEVLPGSGYSVSEDAVAGWKQGSQTCDGVGNTPSSITVGSGETVTCTFVNKKLATITLVKNTVGGDGTFDFVMTGTTLPSSAQLTTVGGTTQQTFNNIDPDNTYSITETPIPAGWDLTASTCTGTNTPSSITPNNGEVITCTFTDTRRASFSLEKISDPSSGSFQFDLTGPQSFNTSTIFTPSGLWNLSNLLPGPYFLIEKILSPENWTGSQDIACNGNGNNDPFSSLVNENPFALTLNPGEDMSCIVNNTEDALISGKKFIDMDADGQTLSDPAYEDGWTINLYDWESETLVSTTETDGNGEFQFLVQPGLYLLCESVPESPWFQFYPESGSSCPGQTFGYELTVTAGQAKSGNDFGNYRDGSISGFKWEDLNGDGEWQNDGENVEPALDDWTIFLDLNDNGVLDEGEPSQITGDEEEGFYSFENLTPGTYIVREVLESGWTQTFPETDTNFKHTVVVTSGENEENWNFGNFQNVTIAGFKWNDKNGNGIRDFNDLNGNKIKDEDEEYTEPGLQDVTIALGRETGPAREDGTIPIEIIALSLTSANGSFTIPNMGPGQYGLFEENVVGWQATNPASRVDSFFDITYRIDLQPREKPLVHDSFFDIFVELSGQNINQGKATNTVLSPYVPLEFGNHRLLVISQETPIGVGQTSVTIQWATDFPGTSRVIYDTVSHLVLGSAPNYGYTNSTATFDENPKVTNHSVSISGLSSGTTYYYRTISAASPESVSGEGSFTSSSSGVGGGGGGGGGGSSIFSTPFPTILPTPTPTPTLPFQTPAPGGNIEISGLQPTSTAGNETIEVQKETELVVSKSSGTANLAGSETAQQNFLAAVGNTFGLGFNSRWLAILILVIVIAALAYFAYRRVKRSK